MGRSTGVPPLFSDQQIEQAYSAWSGYIIGNAATDQGTDEATALRLWQTNGFCGHRIAGSISVDPSNLDLQKLAIYVFENLMFGVNLPDKWISPFPFSNGFVWDVAGEPDPENGHCFGSSKYDKEIYIDEWGIEGTITPAAVEKYASSSAGGSLYSVVTKESLIRGSLRAPNNLDWDQLILDADSYFGGSL